MVVDTAADVFDVDIPGPACAQVYRPREILAGDLPTSVAGIRTALNELVRIVS